MSERKNTARNSKETAEGASAASDADPGLEEELSRFSHRLASFGLGAALDALFPAEPPELPSVQPDAGPC